MTARQADNPLNWDRKEPHFKPKFLIVEVMKYIPNPNHPVERTVDHIMTEHNGDAAKAIRGVGRIVARLRRFRAVHPDSLRWPTLEPCQTMANQALEELKRIPAGKC